VLTLVGDGKHRLELETMVRQLALSDHVHFTGQLPAGDAVRAQLDRADVFVLPSKTEGLPRAMIEAMARGLPCIGSSVGGIPELLLSGDLVPPNDVQALADKIMEFASNPQRMTQSAARNLQKAREYHEDVLRTRRIEFLFGRGAWRFREVEKKRTSRCTVAGDCTSRCGLPGWGGRIRTFDTRLQRPVPYHLATPQ
jgi:glycosyltransferase involved in cell wall biosynthesis